MANCPAGYVAPGAGVLNFTPIACVDEMCAAMTDAERKKDLKGLLADIGS